jgi:hypothetical protein
MTPIAGYEGIYEMDASGNLFSVKRSRLNKLGRLCSYPAKKIKPIQHGTGYLVVNLSRDGGPSTIRLHRLIAETLIPNPDNKPFVNHKDGVKTNNTPSNLEWATEQENTDHAIATGLFKPSGFDNAFAKFTKEDAISMQHLLKYGMQRQEIAKLFQCSRNTVTKTVDRLNRQG